MKTYTFWKSTDGSKEPERYEVKEEDLTQQEKDLLVGTLLNDFDNLPRELQDRVAERIYYNRYIKDFNLAHKL